MLRRFVWNTKNLRVLKVACIVVCSFLLAFILALFLHDLFNNWNNQIIDQVFRLRYQLIGKREVSPYLIHVVVNDSSHQILGLPSWDRNVFGQVIDILQDTNVRLIACDVFFKDTSFSENDELLLKAVKKSRKVIFPVLVYPEEYFDFHNLELLADKFKDILAQNTLYPKIVKWGNPPVGKYIIPPFLELSGAVKGLGHINTSPDSDGMNRRIPLLYHYKNGYIPALSLKIAIEYFRVSQENIDVYFGKHIVLRDARIHDDFKKDVFIPIDKQGRIIVNFVGPWENSFLNFPVHKLLAASIDDESRSHIFDLMEGALVVISDISTTNRDYGPGIFENVYPQSGLHVNIVNSILTESFLSDQNVYESILTALFFVLLLWLFAARFKGIGFSLSCFLLFTMFLVFNLWLFIYMNKVPLIVTPTLGFIFTLISVNVYRIFLVEREKSVYKVKLEANKKLETVNKELVEQKRELEIANEKLEEIDRFKTAFVQNISHEFRTPLTLILEPLESIWNKGEKGLSSFVRKNLELMRKNAHKLLQLINQFLDLSRIEAGKAQLKVRRSDLVDFLRKHLMKFEPMAKGKKVQLKLTSEADRIYSYFDADKLDKIFTNLLSNAIKSTKENDLVEITVAKPEIGEEVAKKIKRREIGHEEMIKIQVRDTGSGIPEKDLPFIFDRFRQVENPAIGVLGGSGVGLSLVKECIEIHNGQIIVESQMGKGTKFTVSLPWAKEHFMTEEIERGGSIPEGQRLTIENTKMSTGFVELQNKAGQNPDRDIDPVLNWHLASDQEETEKIKRIKGSYPEEPILIVDDEIDILESYKINLKENGIDNLILCLDGNEVLPVLKREELSLIMLDLSLPGISGKKILADIKENHPDIHVLVVTGLKDVDSAVECIKIGAFDYMVKPVELSRLIYSLNHCIEKRKLEKEISVLSHKIQSMKLKNPGAFSEIVTNNELMLLKFRYIEAIAQNSNPVLITGESGVGKELVARVIHKLSNRNGTFVSENIAGLDDTMITDTLFGHAKGAFTDAEVVRRGLVEEAREGTLFLDEIGDMSINSQVKLLRFIEEKEYRPLGTDKVKVSDARIIIATNANLKKRLEEGRFRKDLFYRLTYQIDIPPLRERLDDLPYLVDHFMEQTSKAIDKKKPTIPKELSILLRTYSFPGNVRELKNMIENALSRNKSRHLSLSYFREYIQNNSSRKINKDMNVNLEGKQIAFFGEFPTIKEVEDFFVTEALRRSKGNQNVAARLLGLSPSAFSRRLKKRGGKQI